MISPLAGAFLDRAGAIRGIVVDLAVSAAAVLTLAVCVVFGLAGPPVVIALAAAYALTSPLSAAGVRVLLPRFVPFRVLDRANALDTAIHAVVDVIGPSLAGALVGFAGSFATFAVIAAVYGAAALCVALVSGATAPSPSSRGFLGQALEGLAEVLRRPLLRGLAIGYALNNFTWGVPGGRRAGVRGRRAGAGTLGSDLRPALGWHGARQRDRRIGFGVWSGCSGGRSGS